MQTTEEIVQEILYLLAKLGKNEKKIRQIIEVCEYYLKIK